MLSMEGLVLLNIRVVMIVMCLPVFLSFLGSICLLFEVALVAQLVRVPV